jgi:hypothetical protein
MDHLLVKAEHQSPARLEPVMITFGQHVAACSTSISAAVSNW